MINAKLVMVGDTGVGKTSMLIVYTANPFPVEYIPTLFGSYSAHYPIDGTVVNLELWDTVSDEEHAELRPISYPQTDIFVLNFSCTDPASFDNILSKWYPEITHHAPKTPFILVATKTDLRKKKKPNERLRQSLGRETVSKQDGEDMAIKIGACGYFETSSKRGEGVDNVFEFAMKTVLGETEYRRLNSTRNSSKCSLL